MLYICSKCGIEKLNTEFYKKSASARGFRTSCKTCCLAHERANPEKKCARQKRWAAKNPRKVRNLRLQQVYGVTLVQYGVLLDSQNGVCAICQKLCSSGHALGVDHCHETGHIRGLLCKHCNLAIGRLQDSPQNCLAAANYLQQTKQTPITLVDSAGYMSPC